MLPITQDLLNKDRNRPALRDNREYAIRQIRGVIAHWTANTKRGAHAKANRDYFNNTTDRHASAHYVVDDHSIIQCVPDNEVAFHVGARFYKPDGERMRAGYTSLNPNYFVIGFEMCVNEDGDWDKTYRHSVDLAARLLHKYQFSTVDLYRHFDITGKDCPKMMIEEPLWAEFKRRVQDVMNTLPRPPIGKARVTQNNVNVRSGPGKNHPVVAQLRVDVVVEIFEIQGDWHRVGAGRWVHKDLITMTFQTRTGRVKSVLGVNVRSGAGVDFPATDALPTGALVDITGESGEWRQIGQNRWVRQDLIEILDLRLGEVQGTTTLNVRFGPATDTKIARTLPRGARVRIFNEQDGWFQIGVSEWVFGGFVKIV
jgi:N-acetylmuramoyl-L-alanine amidase